MYTGGGNGYGQLGRSTNNKRDSGGEFDIVTVENTPHKVLFVEVAAGDSHTVLLSGVFVKDQDITSLKSVSITLSHTSV